MCITLGYVKMLWWWPSKCSGSLKKIAWLMLSLSSKHMQRYRHCPSQSFNSNNDTSIPHCSMMHWFIGHAFIYIIVRFVHSVFLNITQTQHNRTHYTTAAAQTMRETNKEKKKVEINEEMHSCITSGIGRDCKNEWKKEDEHENRENEERKMICICINLLLW